MTGHNPWCRKLRRSRSHGGGSSRCLVRTFRLRWLLCKRSGGTAQPVLVQSVGAATMPDLWQGQTRSSHEDSFENRILLAKLARRPCNINIRANDSIVPCRPVTPPVRRRRAQHVTSYPKCHHPVGPIACRSTFSLPEAERNGNPLPKKQSLPHRF